MKIYRFLLLITFAAMAILAFAADVENATLSYELRKDSKVSIAIYDQDGGIVRQLLLGADRKAGLHTEEWNGLDDKGKPALAGKYNWKLLSSQGLKSEWITSMGTNLKPGYQIMPGNHVGAVTSVVDDAGDIYIMGGCSEVVPGMVKVQRDGTRLWASDHLLESNNDCGVGLAGNYLLTFLGNAKVIAIDPKTGTGQWKVDTDWNDVNSTWTPGSGVISLAARGNQIVIGNKSLNKVEWLDVKNGKKLDEATIAGAYGLAIGGDGSIFAISGNSVVKFTRENKQPVVVLKSLPAPWRLAVDPVSGDILVAESGDIQQIERYNANGKMLATYGSKGGRLLGKYDPRNFRGITGITADKDGGFIVTEGAAAPRRVALFDKAGKLVREWYGGLAYANGGAGDPDDPSIIWYNCSGQVVKARIDFVKKSYSILAIYQVIGIGDGIISAGNSMDIFSVRHFQGRTYLISQIIEPRIVMVDEKNARMIPMVAGKYFMQHDLNNPTYTPTLFKNAYDALPKDRAKDGVIWTDLNGDGKAQNEEMVFSKRMLMTWACGRVWPDDKMNLYEMNDKPMVWKPKGWTKQGAPIYGGWPDWQPLGDAPKWFNPLNVAWPAGSGIIPLEDGSLMGFFNNTDNPFGKGIGSEGLGGNYIVKWDKTGKAVWCTGFHSPDFGAAPGEGRFFWNFAGTAQLCGGYRYAVLFYH